MGKTIMIVNKTMDKLYDDIQAEIDLCDFKDFEVVEIKESVYRKAIKGEHHIPKDIFNQTELKDQIYFHFNSVPLLLKPVPDNEIENDFQLTTQYKHDVTEGNFI